MFEFIGCLLIEGRVRKFVAMRATVGVSQQKHERRSVLIIEVGLHVRSAVLV